MAPVTGGITDREKDRFVFPARLRERFLAPRIPIDRIMRVLKKIWRLLVREPVRVLGTRRRVLSKRARSMSLTTLTREIQSGSDSSRVSVQAQKSTIAVIIRRKDRRNASVAEKLAFIYGGRGRLTAQIRLGGIRVKRCPAYTSYQRR